MARHMKKPSAILIKDQVLRVSCIEKYDLFRDAHVFGLGEESQRFFTAFTADATLFHPAERNAEIPDEPAIYPNRAGVDSLSDAMRATEVLCPDA